MVVVRENLMDELGQEQEEPILHPFDFPEYWKYLADVVTYDSDGVELSRRRPTEEEARNTQVNSFDGKSRDLKSYI